MQRGSALMIAGVGLIVMGVLALKLTDRNLFWAMIALGAAVGSWGGIQVSERARPNA